jgi:hypothetical protein
MITAIKEAHEQIKLAIAELKKHRDVPMALHRAALILDHAIEGAADPVTVKLDIGR